MGEMPKASLLRHAYYHLGPGPRTVVEHAVVLFLPNGPRPKGHDRVESTMMLPRNFESAGAVPLVKKTSLERKQCGCPRLERTLCDGVAARMRGAAHLARSADERVKGFASTCKGSNWRYREMGGALNKFTSTLETAALSLLWEPYDIHD
uniref:Uncharacterized protein n=1 Tax=Oryza barthii TaxID=65489 RepID=A0A0D3G414_9ORYZ